MLKHHIAKFAGITDSEYDEIFQYFELIEVSKKQTLHELNAVCKHNFFVVKGCLRMFFVTENGTEHTTQFAIENWWLTDLFAYHRQTESEFCIQAVEKSVVLRIKKANEDLLLEKHPVMEKYFRHVYQTASAAAQVREKLLKQYSREQLYIHFSEGFPEFNQRVPQYLVASYLGFTPEYLSEIRQRLSS